MASLSPASLARMRREVELTLEQSEKVCRQLSDGQFSMESRQREELQRFLDAHAKYLQRSIEAISEISALYDLQVLLDRRQELGDALQFVTNAFVAPRYLHAQQQFLEAADWICAEGYRTYLGEQEGPIGPLVAIDSRRSPQSGMPGLKSPFPHCFSVSQVPSAVAAQ